MTNKEQKLKESNERSKQQAIERVKSAYQHWLIHGSTVQACKVWKTDRMKLNKYIDEQGHNRKSCFVDIFDNIDTEEKAYWLGFLYADGSVANKDNHVELSLQLSDIGHLEKYKKFTGTTTSIGQDDHRCRITTCIKEYKQSLIKHGCTPKKSLTMKFPTTVPAELIKHFVRGYFDGDGHLGRNCKDCLWNMASITCGAPDFMRELIAIIKKNCGIKEIGLYRNSRNSNVYNIYFDGEKFNKFVNWIYFDCKVYLERKYQRYIHSVAVILRDQYED